MVTNPTAGKSNPANEMFHRAWRAVALPLMPIGLGIWASGIALNQYWFIVCGTLTIAAGAYKYTDR
jgi:hypothetical protein